MNRRIFVEEISCAWIVGDRLPRLGSDASCLVLSPQRRGVAGSPTLSTLSLKTLLRSVFACAARTACGSTRSPSNPLIATTRYK